MLQVVKAGPEFVIQKSPLFPILLTLSMAERLCAFAADVAVERDFIPQLAGKIYAGLHCASKTVMPVARCL